MSSIDSARMSGVTGAGGHRSTRRGGKRGAEQASLGLLPAPPSHAEKYSYVKRRLWVLTLASIVSFGCLTVSQVALTKASPLMWIFAPPLFFTVVYYLVSLKVNGFTRDFDFEYHQ